MNLKYFKILPVIILILMTGFFAPGVWAQQRDGLVEEFYPENEYDLLDSYYEQIGPYLKSLKKEIVL